MVPHYLRQLRQECFAIQSQTLRDIPLRDIPLRTHICHILSAELIYFSNRNIKPSEPIHLENPSKIFVAQQLRIKSIIKSNIRFEEIAWIYINTTIWNNCLYLLGFPIWINLLQIGYLYIKVYKTASIIAYKLLYY